MRGKTLSEIATIFDSVNTYWEQYGIDTATTDYTVAVSNFAGVLEEVNKRFYSSLDTSNYLIDKNAVINSKKSYAVSLKGALYANQSNILRYRPNKTSLPFIITSGYLEPEGFSLEQNYPNPFNPITMIHYSLPTEGIVTLKIYDVLGQEVATLLNNASMEQGEHELRFDANGFSSGVYFYRIDVSQNGIPHYMATKKLMLVK